MFSTVPSFQTPTSSETPAASVRVARGVPARLVSRSTLKPFFSALCEMVSTKPVGSFCLFSSRVVFPDHCLPEEHGSKFPVGICLRLSIWEVGTRLAATSSADCAADFAAMIRAVGSSGRSFEDIEHPDNVAMAAASATLEVNFGRIFIGVRTNFRACRSRPCCSEAWQWQSDCGHPIGRAGFLQDRGSH